MGSSSWSGSVSVEDLTYDGFKDDSTWTGGLGMLTDGEYGSSNFKVDASTLKGIQLDKNVSQYLFCIHLVVAVAS